MIRMTKEAHRIRERLELMCIVLMMSLVKVTGRMRFSWTPGGTQVTVARTCMAL